MRPKDSLGLDSKDFKARTGTLTLALLAIKSNLIGGINDIFNRH
jgi:hypothetical protein